MKTCAILLLFCIKSYSQTIISGKIVTKEGLPIEGVNITVKTLNSNPILSFSISKSNGDYTLKFSSEADSVQIFVKKLNYTQINKTIVNAQNKLDFTLEKGSFELMEVKIRPPVRKIGDTLSYSVEAFKSESDRVIADLIAKLPGVEIDGNGQIKYLGEPINKYYVEGLDLMGGAYGLINENLSVNQVVAVEVFEKHQPIRILENVRESKKAAINIRLKKKVTASYAGHYGFGYKPFIYDGNLTPMLFTPKLQAVGSYQANNVGDNIKRQIINQTSGGANSAIQIAQGWLNVNPIRTPAFTPKRWLDNQSQMGSLNLLRKTSRNLQFKVNTAISLDKQRQAASLLESIFVGADTIQFRENIKSDFRYNELSTSLNIEKNSSKGYFVNVVKFNKEWDVNNSSNARDDRLFKQGIASNNYYFGNNFNTVLKKKRIFYNLFSNLNFGTQSQELLVQSISVDSSASPVQKFDRSYFNAHNYVRFDRQFKDFTMSFTAGSEIDFNKILTSLSGYPGIPDPHNNFVWNTTRTYASMLSRNQLTKRLGVTLEVPLAYRTIIYEQGEVKKTFDKIAIEPRFGVNLKISQYGTIDANGQYSKSFAGLGDIYDQPIMSNYLMVTNRNNDFRNDNIYSIGANYRLNNVTTLLTGNLSYRYNINARNLLANSQIIGDGSSEAGFTGFRNVSTSHVVVGRISKNFIHLKLRPLFLVNYFLSNTPSQVNSDIRKFSFSSLLTSFQLDYSGIKKVDLNYRINSIASRNSNSTLHQFNQSLQGGVYITKKYFLKTTLEHYRNKINNSKNDYVFSDLLLRLTVPKTKHDIEFSVNNLLNIDVFETITVSDYRYSESEYKLRPRQFMVRGRIHI